MLPSITTHDSEIDDIDVDLLEYLLTLTPAQRVERHEAALELVRLLKDLILAKRTLGRPKDRRVARELELVLARVRQGPIQK